MTRSNDYKTKQRESIVAYLKENKDNHVSVNDIISFLDKINSPVALTTVYRYLDKLIKDGSVRKYLIEDTRSALYQYIDNGSQCNFHYHLKCLDCGILMHIDCNYLQDIDTHLNSHHKFKLDNSKTVLYGHCEHCAYEKK